MNTDITNTHKIPANSRGRIVLLSDHATMGDFLYIEVEKCLKFMFGKQPFKAYDDKGDTSPYFTTKGITRDEWNRIVKPKIQRLAEEYQCQFIMLEEKPSDEWLEFEFKKN